MKRIITLTLVLLAITFNAYAIELGDNVNLDMEAKYRYVVNNLASERIDEANKRFSFDLNTNYLLDTEVGVKLYDAVRIAGKYSYTEHVYERYGVDAEVFIPSVKFVDMGIVAGAEWLNNNITNNESEPVYSVGLVFRVE